MASGYRLQLGVLGLIARDGHFESDDGPVSGNATEFEFWSLRKKDGEFGERFSPLKKGPREGGLERDEFLPKHEHYLHEAIARYINGSDPFTAKDNPNYPGFDEYDQLMRLSEWMVHQIGTDGEGET